MNVVTTDEHKVFQNELLNSSFRESQVTTMEMQFSAYMVRICNFG